MLILAVDPGTARSAWVVLEGNAPIQFGIYGNEQLLEMLRNSPRSDCVAAPDRCHLVIEKIQAMGMSVGAEVFETVYWSGQFAEAWSRNGGFVDRVGRRDVKLHLCGTNRAKDVNVRQAIIDRFGGETKAIGSVKCVRCKGRKLVGLGKKRGACDGCGGSGWKNPPGVLHGVGGDVWSAIAVGLTYYDASGAETTGE